MPLLTAKEPLAIVNGTAISTSLAALTISEVAHLALLSLICTAQATEALLGSKGERFHNFGGTTR